MKMKRRLGKLIALMLVCLLTLSGCEDEKHYTSADFVGVWGTEYELGREAVEFFADGTFEKYISSVFGDVYLSGTYTVDTDTVTVFFSQTGEEDVFTYKFESDTKMIWKLIIMEDVEYTYIKR